jgi:predicted TPR repeat methyltransferase
MNFALSDPMLPSTTVNLTERSRALNQQGLDFVNANNWLGAKESFEEAIFHHPTESQFLNNLGNVLAELQDFESAQSACQKAITINPTHESAHLNLANLLMQLERRAEAKELFLAVLKLNAQSFTALIQLSVICFYQKDHEQALLYVDRALALQPNHITALLDKSSFHTSAGETEAAIETLERVLSIDPSNATAQFHLAKFGKGPTPHIAPQSYVTDLFDEYAHNFEHQLMTQLKYQTPQHIAQIVTTLEPTPLHPLCRVLDLGCGTGLVAEHLNRSNLDVTGIDLSPKMLDVARRKHCYTNLIQSDVAHYLSTCTQRFQLVVSADVFVYIGRLDDIFHNVHRVLEVGGWFIFSVEYTADSLFTLRGSARYAHSEAYVHELARNNGFLIQAIHKEVIRFDGTTPVAGLLVTLHKQSNETPSL